MFHFNFLHGPHTVGSDLKGITRVLSEVCASEIFEMEFGSDTCSTFNSNIHIGTCWCSIFVSCHCYNFIIWKIKKNLQFVQNCPYPWWKLFKILLSVLENWIISYDSKHLLYHKQIIKKGSLKSWSIFQEIQLHIDIQIKLCLQSCLPSKHNELTCFWWDIWEQFPGCLLIPMM